eukprot:TRINITY_DN24234_c0_g1_i2.p1 TRINITY_DN24234_c0_g1~~TRINITY_DN24234_c0_g1_i2.p1  ORF type:complete len:216 (-),score=77.87 TRINITY_DN24234_c0_g1_i2:67-714(-)
MNKKKMLSSSKRKHKGKAPQPSKQDKGRLENGKKVMATFFDKVRARQPKTGAGESSEGQKGKSIKELYKGISLKSPVMKCYAEVMRCQMGRPPDKIYIKEFIQFVKAVAPEIYENNAKDLFYYLYKDLMLRGSPKESDEDKQFLSAEELGRRYDEYVAGEENLKGVLSMHNLKTRNYELQQKLAYWKSTRPRQKSLHARHKKKTCLLYTSPSPRD